MKKKLLLTSLIFLFIILLASCNRASSAPEIDTVNGMTLLKSQSLNGYIVTSYEGEDKVINVPASHKGLDIVRIHFIAFTNSLVEEINLPKTISAFFGLWRTFNLKYINVHPDNPSYYSKDGIVYSKDKKLLIQFPQNHDLKNFIIPSQVKEINNNAFVQTKNLKKVELHSEITKINDLTFQYSNIEEVIIPKDSKLKSIGELAFDHSKISSINLPDSVEEIGYGAFNNTYIKELHFGSKLELLDNAFEGMNYLEEVTVNSNNKHFTAINNVLYNADRTTLIHYPKLLKNSVYNLPSTVKKFEDDSISNNLYLKDINTISLVFKSDEGILYNNDYSKIIVYPKLNETKELQIGLNLFGVEEIENIAQSPYLERIVSDPNHSRYFSADGVLYNREITELLIYPKSNLVESFYINRVVERIRYQNFAPQFLKNVVVDENNQSFSSEDGILYNKSKTQLILVPQSKQIEELVINKNVYQILGRALNNPYIKKITVDQNNYKYYSLDGVLYERVDTDKSILVKVPTAKEVIRFNIKEDVYEVSEYAFYYHMYIEEIDFSKSKHILTLNNCSIVNIVNLNKITINVNSVISEYTFSYDEDVAININVVLNNLYETLLWDFNWHKTSYKINIK